MYLPGPFGLWSTSARGSSRGPGSGVLGGGGGVLEDSGLGTGDGGGRTGC